MVTEHSRRIHEPVTRAIVRGSLWYVNRKALLSVVVSLPAVGTGALSLLSYTLLFSISCLELNSCSVLLDSDSRSRDRWCRCPPTRRLVSRVRSAPVPRASHRELS